MRIIFCIDDQHGRLKPSRLKYESKYAFSYASIGGKVTMTLAQEEPYIRLRVYNTGAPIDQKDLPHL